MNKHYDDILNWRDKRFIELFNKITVNNKSERDDLKQDFCFKLLKYKDSFIVLEGEQIYYYSVSILKRLVTSYCKYNSKYDREVEFEIPTEYDFDKSVEIDRLYKYISTLPYYEKELITLYYLEDNTYRDIKELTKIPITSLNTTIKKVINKIKKNYGIDTE